MTEIGKLQQSSPGRLTYCSAIAEAGRVATPTSSAPRL